MKKYEGLVQDEEGDKVSNATITVKDYVGGANSTVYGADLLGSNINGFTNNSDGTFEFFAKDGRYNVEISKPGLTTKTISNILIQHPVDIVSVKGYGAQGDGTTDDTTPIQAALTAGGAIFVPPGIYLVSANLTMSVANTKLFGAGKGSNLRTSSATLGIITVSAQFCQIDSLYFNASVTQTAGWFVDFASGANRSTLQNFHMDGAIGGWRTIAGASAWCMNGTILNSVASTGVAMRVNGGADVRIIGITADAASQIFANIYVTATADLLVEGCNLIHGGSCLTLAPAAGQVISSVWCIGTFFDTSTRSAFFNPIGIGASIVRCSFTKCWFGGSSASGVRMETATSGIVDGVDFVDCNFVNNTTDGLQLVDTGVTNVRVNGGFFAGNGDSGIAIGQDVSEWSVQGARIGDSHGLTANNYGIFIAAGASTNYQIINNDLRGNTTASINGVSGVTGTNGRIDGNSGYNPVGASAITVGASPYTYTAGPSPETVYISAGTVSDIALGGQTMFTATEKTVQLGPNEAVIVTYSGLPTMKKYIH